MSYSFYHFVDFTQLNCRSRNQSLIICGSQCEVFPSTLIWMLHSSVFHVLLCFHSTKKIADDQNFYFLKFELFLSLTSFIFEYFFFFFFSFADGIKTEFSWKINEIDSFCLKNIDWTTFVRTKHFKIITNKKFHLARDVYFYWYIVEVNWAATKISQHFLCRFLLFRVILGDRFLQFILRLRTRFVLVNTALEVSP